MISLTVLYLCGGQSLFNMSNNIAGDERTHITTNRYILRQLGYDPRSPQPHLDVFRYESLDWMLDGLNLPRLGIDKDMLIQCSNDLVRTGKSRNLQELTGGARYQPPFETPNKRSY